VSRATLVPTVPVTSTETRSRSPCQSLLLTRLVGPVSLTFSLPSSLSPPRSPRYLDTNKGRDVGKFVVKVYPPEHTLLRHKSTAHAHILLPPPLYANETFSLPPLPFPLLAPLFLALLLFQTYATEAKEFGTAEDIREAQEMAAQWLPDKKQQ
jgi:hypothetical protein